MKYQGLSGMIYEVEEKRLAGGGEGNVHAITGNENQVAKIFKEGKRDVWREKKLRLMMQEKLSESQSRQVTWPQDVIYDQNGFAGYIMPKLVNSSSLTELYTEEKYDFRFRLVAAANLCAAIDTVHQMGQVCGDLNPQNIFVNLDKNDRENAFKVTLVDTDSYHFTANETTYRCEVGLGEFIAPELQKKMSAGCNLKTVPLPSYTRETDLFALAVHIFCLLMNGCHPFACAKDTSPGESNISQMAAGKKEDSIVCPQPIENIKNGFFPFHDKRDGIVIPVYAPEFGSLPDEIRSMFIRTFVDGYMEPSKRVTASEWWEVLCALSKDVRNCAKAGSHYYFSHVPECPLCKVEERLTKLYPSPPPTPPLPPPPPTPPIQPNDDKLPLRYRIGSIIMFVCAGIMVYDLLWPISWNALFQMLGRGLNIILPNTVVDVYWVDGIICVEIYVHSGLLLRRTQLSGKGFLVFYSILLGISVLWFLSVFDVWYVMDRYVIDIGICVVQITGCILLIMKYRYWKGRQKTTSN